MLQLQECNNDRTETYNMNCHVASITVDDFIALIRVGVSTNHTHLCRYRNDYVNCKSVRAFNGILTSSSVAVMLKSHSSCLGSCASTVASGDKQSGMDGFGLDVALRVVEALCLCVGLL